MGIRRTIDIERLLSWAYRDELPKRELSSSGWDGVASYLSVGAVEIDADPWEAHLRSQRYAYVGKPHEDAITLDFMVNGLEDAVIQWPAAKPLLLGPLAHYLTPQAEFLIRKMKAHTAGLVRTHGKMGTRPMWDLYWRLDPVMLRNRTPLVQYVDRHGKVVDCHSGKRDYLRGGRCPLVVGIGSRPGERDRLGEPLAEIASARFEYIVWRSALVELVTMTNAGWPLKDHAPQNPAAAVAPWLEGREPRPRILDKISARENRLTIPRKDARRKPRD